MTVTEPRDPAEIRRKARERARRMGIPVLPDPDAAPQGTAESVQLPTDNLFALRGLLMTNRLTAAQVPVVRRLLAEDEAARKASLSPTGTPTPNLPSGDAA